MCTCGHKVSNVHFMHRIAKNMIYYFGMSGVHTHASIWSSYCEPFSACFGSWHWPDNRRAALTRPMGRWGGRCKVRWLGIRSSIREYFATHVSVPRGLPPPMSSCEHYGINPHENSVEQAVDSNLRQNDCRKSTRNCNSSSSALAWSSLGEEGSGCTVNILQI